MMKFILGHQTWVKGKPNCAKAISDLINLFNQDSYPLAKIKELLHEIKNDHIDLYNLLTKSDYYREGFVNYINDIKEIKSEWWDELEDELSHLQSEIAFRREEDVKNCVLNFYINKIEKSPDESDKRKDPLPPPPIPDKIKKAKDLVKGQTMPSMMWQKVVLDMIDNHPEISSFVIDYLGDKKH